jgi:hypothetical protein
MAKVPTIGIGSTQLANPRLTTTAPQAEQTQTLGVGKGVASFGGALETTSDAMYKKLDDARNYAESAKAEIYVADELQKLTTEMTTGVVKGPDGKLTRRTGSPEDIQYYREKERQILETAQQFHSSKEEAVRSSVAYAKAGIVANHSIQNAWLKTRISEGVVAGYKKTDGLTKLYAKTGDPAILTAINDNMKQMTDLGLITPEEAYAKEKEATLLAKNSYLATLPPDEAMSLITEKNYFEGDQKATDTALSVLEHRKNLEDKQKIMQNTGYDIQTILDVAGHKISVADMPRFLAEVSKKSTDLAEAVVAIQKADMEYTPDKEEDINTGEAFKTILKSKDPIALANFTKDVALKKINPELRATLLQVAIDQWKSIEKGIKTPQQIENEAGLLDTINWADQTFDKKGDDRTIQVAIATQYLANINQGMTAQKASEDAKKVALAKKYPQTATMENPPNMVIQDNSPVRVIFPNNSKLTPSRVYNPKTKSAEPVAQPNK